MSGQGVTLVHEAITAGLELGTRPVCELGVLPRQVQPCFNGSLLPLAPMLVRTIESVKHTRVSNQHQQEHQPPTLKKSSHLKPADP